MHENDKYKYWHLRAAGALRCQYLYLYTSKAPITGVHENEAAERVGHVLQEPSGVSMCDYVLVKQVN